MREVKFNEKEIRVKGANLKDSFIILLDVAFLESFPLEKYAYLIDKYENRYENPTGIF